MSDQPVRPPGFVSGVVVSPKIAYLLETRADLTKLRTSARGEDSELDAVLNAIRWAAMQWAASVNGSEPRKPAEGRVNWYTPAQIATQIHIGEHAVRLAIREGRLQANKSNGRWLITPADYRAFLAQYRNQ